ncbi:MAG: class I SAM-dependent methyltransferase [Holosporaceae bacterium]|jgi:hypothetical protein|nr:class I SAM-dependent methyltransferase [Holosporaceae bacterium]
MVKHLEQKAKSLEKYVSLKDQDLVIDIGSNDATLLKAYSKKCVKIGINPTGLKFKKFYTDDICLIADFFSASKFLKQSGGRKAKVITSIAMFYDLEDPCEFVKDIKLCLEKDGIWHFEQSYLPFMLRTNSYDTIYHEHLEFYFHGAGCKPYALACNRRSRSELL